MPQVGMSIRDELGQHAILLDELDEESNALQSKLRLVHKKMDKVTAEMSQKSKVRLFVPWQPDIC